MTVDEHHIKKYMKDNYALAFWFRAGGLFAVGKHSIIVHYISGIFVAVWVFLFPLLLITLYKAANGEELERLIESIHFAVFVIIEMIFLVSCNMNKQIFAKLFTGFHDYQNTLDEKCLKFSAKSLEESKRKKAIIAKMFIGVVMCACITITILRPIMKYLLGEHLLGEPDD
ncbi:Odorant receptor 146, partial [Halyomorpha halys]